MYRKNSTNFNCILLRRPDAQAIISGNSEHPKLRGVVNFYSTQKGVIVSAEIRGLPNPVERCQNPVFGFHIHEGDRCKGNSLDEFASAMTHYNPENCLHPFHAGDMPPLFGNGGYAFVAFLTNRFTLSEIIGKTVIIHSAPDDFATQPSGNAGRKIACGIIVG